MKNEDEIELSVVLPIYNVEAYLSRCIDSILNQTYKVGEIICVDDGSTDGSLEIILQYSRIDNRIKMIHKENGGLVSARKAGLMSAKGKYVTYVDSDDWIEENMYEEMMEVARNSGADVITSGSIRDYGTHCIEENEKIEAGIYEGRILNEKILHRMIETNAFFRSNISHHVYNKVFKKDLLMKYQMQVDDFVNVGEDMACTYPCILNAKKIAVTGKSYYHYCMRADSIMGTKKMDEGERYKVLFDGLYAEFVKHKDGVSNIMTQFEFMKAYVLLLKRPQEIVAYNNEKLYPFGKVKNDARIIIYGAGRFGVELKNLLEKKYCCNVVAWVDKQPKQGILGVDDLNDIAYDVIIVAVLLSDVMEQIKKELLNKKVNKNNILNIDVKLL